MNFGVLGVVVYFLGLGALLAWMAGPAVPARPLPLACAAVILGPLLWTTRNSFEIFFRPAVWGLAAVWAVHWLSTLAPSRTHAHSLRPPDWRPNSTYARAHR
jgi:hypothetical protein